MSTLTQSMPPRRSQPAMSPAERLAEWNRAEEAVAAASILPCNGAPAWAEALVARRPLDTPEALFSASDEVWAGLSTQDWQSAFDSHPRIGETQAVKATAQSLHWSHGEQATASPDQAALTALALGNKVYEETFGRIFIVCATGKSAAEMLELLESRLLNDAATELETAAEEQRKITQLRLRKWLGAPAGVPAERR